MKRMSELDHLREEVAYLKFWLGIVVVTDISLAGCFSPRPTLQHRTRCSSLSWGSYC
jgi:hypothetical protein